MFKADITAFAMLKGYCYRQKLDLYGSQYTPAWSDLQSCLRGGACAAAHSICSKMYMLRLTRDGEWPVHEQEKGMPDGTTCSCWLLPAGFPNGSLRLSLPLLAGCSPLVVLTRCALLLLLLLLLLQAQKPQGTASAQAIAVTAAHVLWHLSSDVRARALMHKLSPSLGRVLFGERLAPWLSGTMPRHAGFSRPFGFVQSRRSFCSATLRLWTCSGPHKCEKPDIISMLLG